jgi:hypothetical protein
MDRLLTLDGYSRGPAQLKRFEDRSVMQDCPVEGLEGQCWVLPANQPTGYAVTTLRMNDGKSKTLLVHRVAYMLMVGPIPSGLEIDHLCNVHTCWNPQHLEAVTRGVNMRRSNAGAKPNDRECRNGHLRTPENTYSTVFKDGRTYRSCRECAQVRDKKRRRPEDFSK